MSKVKTFFHVFTRSLIPGASYYPRLKNASLGFSVKYYISLVYFLNFLLFVALLIKIGGPNTIIQFKQAVETSFNAFPKNLVIELGPDGMTTNADHPYFWWLHFNERVMLAAVFDSSATAEKINEYNSLLLFTPVGVVVNKSPSGQNGAVYEYRQHVLLNKQVASEIAQKIPYYFRLLVFLGVPFLILIAPLFAALAIFLYVVLLAAIAHLLYIYILKGNRRHTFKETLQVALHAATLPLVALYIVRFLSMGGENVSYLPFVFVNLFIIFTLGGLWEAYHTTKK